MNKLFSDIQSHCRRLNHRHLGLALGVSFAAWATIWTLIAGLDFYINPMRESTAAVLLISLPILIVWACIWVYRRNQSLFTLNPRRLAQRIEHVNAGLNDLVITATELEGRKSTSLNPLETHVIESATDALDAFDWRSASTKWYEKSSTIVATFVFASLITAAALKTQVFKKAVHHIEDTISGVSTGLVIQEYPSEVPFGSDLSIQVKVNRGEKKARIHWRDSNGEHAEVVVIDTAGDGSFTLYGLEELTHFKFTTPSLASSWRSVDVYQPAKLNKVQIELTPPAYTQLEATQFDQLVDLQVPEGSTLKFDMQSEAAASIHLERDDDRMGLEPKDNGSFQLAFAPEESGSYHFELTDTAGRQENSPAREISIILDQPPSVEILKPSQDQTLAPDQELRLHLYASDDYGIANAHVHLKPSNSEEQVLGLPMHDHPEQELNSLTREAELQASVSLKQLGAKDGEFLTLHVTASDNREPIANQTRSDVLFIEIRTPIPPEERDGMPMEQKQINLRELIDEQKRILRETYRLKRLAQEDLVNQSPELASALSALHVEINRIFNEVREDLSAAGQVDLIELFTEAASSNQKAIKALEIDRPETAIEPQSTTLSNLLKLENAFRQNTISKKPSEGKGQGQSESNPESKGNERPSEGENALDQLMAARAELESIIAQQNQLNSNYDRAQRSEWTKDAAEESASSQKSLERGVASLRDQVSQIQDSARLQSMLNGARGHMSTAGTGARQADASASLRSGLRARESLRRATAELDTMISESSEQQLASAANAAAQLAQSQSEAAAASQAAAEGNPSLDQLAGLEAAQRALRERYENFLNALEQEARSSAGASPEVSQALTEAATQAKSQPTGAQMERAANALLYGQAGMAAPIQSSAASELMNLSKSLAEAREQLGNNPTKRAQALNRELMAALEELASYARSPQSADSERLDAIRENWSARLEELNEIFGDSRFGSLSGQLGLNNEGERSNLLPDTRNILQQSARVLHQHLFQEASLSDMKINRETAPPPNTYRRMVEEYFRRLANESTTE